MRKTTDFHGRDRSRSTNVPRRAGIIQRFHMVMQQVSGHAHSALTLGVAAPMPISEDQRLTDRRSRPRGSNDDRGEFVGMRFVHPGGFNALRLCSFA
jgi:hypothetical protein